MGRSYHSYPNANSRASSLAYGELVWLIFLAPAVLLPGRLFPSAWHWIVVILLFALWPLYLVVYPPRGILRSWLMWPIILLLLCLPITLYVSVDKARTWSALGYLLLGIAFCSTLVDIALFRRRPILLAWLVVTVGVGLAALGLVLQLGQPAPIIDLPPLHAILQPLVEQLGETINANILAGGLVLMLPVTLAIAMYYVSVQREGPATVAILAFFLMLAVVLVSKSRGGYLASAVALTVVFVTYWPRLLYGLPIVLGAVAFALYRIGPWRVLDTLMAGGALEGLGGRTEIWARALYALEDFTFTGIGFGLFDRIVPYVYPFYGTEIPTIPHAHNLFLQIGVDLGILGLLAMTGLWYYVLLMLMRVRTAPRSDASHDVAVQQRALTAGLLGALAAMHIHGLFDAPTWGTKLAFIPWLIYACAVLLFMQVATPDENR